jgi:predicted AlkP superfamily phosphohydrolase/phosphomutase
MFPADAVLPLAVSGYPAPDRAGAGAVYPPAAEDALRQAIPEFQANPALPFAARPGESREQAHARAIRDAAAADAHRVTTAFDHAVAGGPLDLAMAVFSFPDHLFHSHYACVAAGDDAPAPILAMRRVADEALGRIDDAVGRIIDRFGDPATVLVVSDHGLTAKRGSVHVAECLAQAGLLAPAGLGFLLKRAFRRWRVADSSHVLLDDDPWTDCGLDWGRTRAFPGYDHEQGVFVNLRGRNPRGIVAPEDYGAVVERARQAILAVRDPATGDRPVRAARRRDEVYSGPYLDRAPDLLVEPADGWQVRRKLSWRMRGRSPISRHAGLGGVHHPDGILIAAGPAVKPGAAPARAEMADIAATVLALAGLAPADPLDGRPLEEVFTLPAARESVRLDGPVPGAASGYTEADENEVARRLEDLGYL